MLLGSVLTIGSCFFFGSAAKEAAQRRQVATATIEPGDDDPKVSALVDPASMVKLSFTAVVEISDEVMNDPNRSPIFQSEVPLNYRVVDDGDALLHVGAGGARCSTIIPDQDSPHYDNYDRTITCGHESEPFESSEQRVNILVELPDVDDHSNSVKSLNVEVFDRLGNAVEARAIGGMVTLFVGPLVAIIGTLVLFIGLLVRDPKRKTGAHST